MKLFKKKNGSEEAASKNAPKEPSEQPQQTPNKHPMQIAFENNLKFLNQESYPAEFFKSLFTENDRIKTFTAGNADFPTGQVVIADPLVYLGTKYQTLLEREIPKGSYPAELSVLYSQTAGIRIAAARLRIKEEEAISYTRGEARVNPDGKRPFCFMGVDAGVACFTDLQIAAEYNDFLVKWHRENPDKNHYDDYFAEFFAQSYEKFPQFQREGGDFIEWQLPRSGNRLVMFASGLGDGMYSGYWGENSKGEITELVIPFLNPELF